MGNPRTQHSLKLLRDEGYLVDVAEYWQATPYSAGPGVRKDLHGFIDLLAFGNGITLLVQCTSAAQVAAHLRKMDQIPAVYEALRSGCRVEVHGWDQTRKGARWQLTKRIKFELPPSSPPPSSPAQPSSPLASS